MAQRTCFAAMRHAFMVTESNNQKICFKWLLFFNPKRILQQYLKSAIKRIRNQFMSSRGSSDCIGGSILFCSFSAAGNPRCSLNDSILFKGFSN